MKKILKQGVYRTKCPYCDCEFEYEREDVVSKSLKNPPYMWSTHGSFSMVNMVRCPSCNNLIYHHDSVRSKIETVSL